MNEINAYEYLIILIRWCQEDTITHSSREEKISGKHALIIGGTNYLLQQSVRQVWNKKGHKCVSKKALELWKKLKIDQSIFDFSYQEAVYYKNTEEVYIECFNGANSKPYWSGNILYKGNKEYFRWRSVFHFEHIVPIKIIVNQLLNIDLSKSKNEIYDDIDSILGKIYVCYMLKAEDRKLNKISKNNRSDNYLEVINKEYKKAGIEIAEWDSN